MDNKLTFSRAQSQILEECPNCHKQVKQVKLAPHLAYCQKNYLPCPKCGEFTDRNMMEEHEMEKHTSKNCPFCSAEIIVSNLIAHIKD